MRIPRILTSQPLEVGLSIVLEAQASDHMLKVLRLRRDDKLIIFNGNGKEYVARISESTPKNAVINVESLHRPQRESPLIIGIAQGVSRGERMDFVLQKSVELGVDVLTPVWTERCQVHLSGTRLQKRVSHWQGIINSACEQSGRLRIPTLEPPVALDDLVHRDCARLKLVMDPDASLSLKALEPSQSIQVLIGPEGGLSNNEIAHAEEHGYMRVRLGPRVLRTETAALAILASLQTLWGDL